MKKIVTKNFQKAQSAHTGYHSCTKKFCSIDPWKENKVGAGCELTVPLLVVAVVVAGVVVLHAPVELVPDDGIRVNLNVRFNFAFFRANAISLGYC